MSQHTNEGIFVQYADDAQLLLADTTENTEGLVKKAKRTFYKAKNDSLHYGLLLNAKKTVYIYKHYSIHK